MDESEENPNEVTVRLTLNFMDAPEVYTLLSMTPPRERRKLIRHALTRFIVETKHPAGDPEVQLKTISDWLETRKRSAVEGIKDRSSKAPNKPVALNEPDKLLAHAAIAGPKNSPVSVPKTPQSKEGLAALIHPSRSLGRWLNE